MEVLKSWGLVALIAAVVAFLALGAASSPRPAASSVDSPAKEKSRLRASIRACWDEYERKSLDPAEKRFVAGACEILEKRLDALR